MYVDVHTHLTHEKFANDLATVIQRAQAAGLKALIVNGLEPASNRQILELAKTYEVVKPALGIYPIDAVNSILPKSLPFSVQKFDVDQEIDFIGEQARKGALIAIGECGLDGHWVGEDTFSEQERVFSRLIEIAMACDLPIIIHTRKCEERAVEILIERKVKKVNFHCFGGRTNLAQKCAEDYGWWFSIPANANVNQAFQKMLKTLPKEKILTETDAPYLAPIKGARNEPANVVQTVELLAKFRGWTNEQAKEQVWSNFKDLFVS